MEFTLQETLQDAIIAHKFLMNMYGQFEIECSTERLRKLMQELHAVASKHNLKIFKVMNKEGFYPTTPAPEEDIKNAIKMHTDMQNELKQKLNYKD